MRPIAPAALLSILLPGTALAEQVTVFAAASLIDAIEEIGEAWVAAGHEPWRLSFGASSTLAQQIIEGAPGDIFISASEQWMDSVADEGLLVAGSRTSPLSNSLVLIAPAGEAPAGVVIGPDLDLAGLLGPDGVIAMADPERVPAGQYGKESLTNLGLWDSISGKVAGTEDVRAALALVESGEAPLGVVYATDAAISDGVAVVATFPADSHAPISYPFGLLDSGNTDAQAAFDFLLSEPSLDIFARYGFVVD
jgi:molybdate transport system substrate-binding protein